MAAKRRKRPLHKWNQLTEFVKVIYATGQVHNCRPQSVILVATPGSGKTEFLDRFRCNTWIDFYSDITFQKLIPVFRRVLRGYCTHICVTEFQKLIGRRKSVSDNTLLLMLQGMEEGVWKMAFGPQEYDLGGARLGVVAATTPRSIERHPYLITDMEIDSRAWFVDFQLPIEEIREIEHRIVEGDESSLQPIFIPHSPEPWNVVVPHAIGDNVRLWVEDMRTKNLPTYGPRTVKRLLFLLKGVAYLNKRKKATKADLDELYRFRHIWLEPIELPGIQTGEPETPTDPKYFDKGKKGAKKKATKTTRKKTR